MRVIHGSDTYPEMIVKSAGKTQVRYDIEEVTLMTWAPRGHLTITAMLQLMVK